LHAAPRSRDDSRSIGDVVQGLHGGKYQFNDAGISFEGKAFAENGYGPTSIEEDTYENEPLPQWALRMKGITQMEGCPELSIDSGSISIQIKNVERSWEKYYAFLVGENAGSLAVEPNVGILAPRGGTETFQDNAKLTITGIVGDNCIWLVVGTEAEKWVYRCIN
jgi:hypothetical protein